MHTRSLLAISLLGLATATAALAATPIIYPAKGQTPEQQTKDTTECHAWAKQSTGIDPAALDAAPAQTATAAPPQDTGPSGARLKGAAKGAAAGAVVGEIANDDASDGAKVGAAAGVVAGGRAERKGKAAASQQAAQADANAKAEAEAAKAAKMDTFNRATAACMEGRSYTIK